MKTYTWLRGILKASAFTTVMFVMQACYGTPQQYKDPYYEEEETNWQATDSIQTPDQDVPMAEVE